MRQNKKISFGRGADGTGSGGEFSKLPGGRKQMCSCSAHGEYPGCSDFGTIVGNRHCLLCQLLTGPHGVGNVDGISGKYGGRFLLRGYLLEKQKSGGHLCGRGLRYQCIGRNGSLSGG